MNDRRMMKKEINEKTLHITYSGNPRGKPRQTRSDKWKKRKCVVQYRQWADGLRKELSVFIVPQEPDKLIVTAYIEIPKSWSKMKKEKMKGKPHKQTPDSDNILKAVCDAIWKGDQVLYNCHVQKFWDDGNGARTEISIVREN